MSEEKKTCKKKCDCKEKEVQKEESNDKSTKELENTKTDIIKKPSLIAKIQKPLPEKNSTSSKTKEQEL